MSYSYDYPRPAVTVDALVFGASEQEVQLLLIRRQSPPFQGAWSLPGGFLDMDETPEQAVGRELKEETGLRLAHWLHVGGFGAINRDPRQRTISLAYLSLLDPNRQLPAVEGKDDALEAAWHPLHTLPELAFDHLDILQCARERLQHYLSASRRQKSYFPISTELFYQKLLV